MDPKGDRATLTKTTGTTVDAPQFTEEVAHEFHRRMSAIIDAVQAGIWQCGLHQLLGYATDYAVGQERGRQTLVLKTRGRSSYVRLEWDCVLGDTPGDRKLVDDAISRAISELS
jgi:hypothetical protein